MSQQKIVGGDILLEFLEVAIHNILYVRDVYPKEIFVPRKMYGIAVRISEHPDLNSYIKEVLNCVSESIKRDENSVKKIILSFYDQNKVVVEQFVFDFVALRANLQIKDPFFLKTEEALRTFCLKLSTCGAYLKPLPENATFAVYIHTTESSHVALSENPKCEHFPWIEADEDAFDTKEQTLLPLNKIDTEHLMLQIYAVEKHTKM